jgi:lipoprotein-anchoring transpeptidase ErfK/SrfK
MATPHETTPRTECEKKSRVIGLRNNLPGGSFRSPFYRVADALKAASGGFERASGKNSHWAISILSISCGVGSKKTRNNNTTLGNSIGLFLLGSLLLLGVGGFGWQRGWFKRFAKEPARKTANVTTNLVSTVVATNKPASNAPAKVSLPSVPVVKATNPPPVTAIVTAKTTNGVASKSSAVLDAQVALDRMAISPGSIDGVLGLQTRCAVRAFQTREGLPVTGELDPETRSRLSLAAPALTTYEIAEKDLLRLLPVPKTWMGKSESERLDYETLIELVAERSHAHPLLLKRLNPSFAWDSPSVGVQLSTPRVERVPPRAKAALLRIHLAERTLQAFSENGDLLAHFPCSIAQRVEKRPVGELHVAVVAPQPNYTFDPEVFPESAEAREIDRKLIIPPGPNNPVGTVWIGLDKPGYGIHGTPRPEEVGRTESHGCFRLANWNAEYLLQLVAVGTPVIVE